MLLDLDLGLALHVLGDARAPDFALDAAKEEFQALSDVEPLENFVLVRNLEVEIRRGEIGEAARIRDIHLEDRRHFVRNAIDQLGQRLGAGHDPGDEIIDLVRIGRNLLGRLDSDDRERLGLRYAFDDDPPQSLKCDLNGLAGKIDALVHPRRDSNSPHESLGVEHVVVITSGDHEADDQPRLLVRFEERQVLGRAHLHGDCA